MCISNCLLDKITYFVILTTYTVVSASVFGIVTLFQKPYKILLSNSKVIIFDIPLAFYLEIYSGAAFSFNSITKYNVFYLIKYNVLHLLFKVVYIRA